MVSEGIEGCVRERKRYQQIIKNDPSKIDSQNNEESIRFFHQKIKQNRSMERAMVEQVLRVSRRWVRFAAKGPTL